MMPARDRMLDLLRRFGWNATSFQALEPSFDYWFDEEQEAAVAFFDTGSSWVVAGPPVADESVLADTARRFTAVARRAGRRVVFFGVEERFLSAIALDRLAIGLQPRWDPRTWDERHRGHRSFREQLRRARKKGVSVTRVEGEELSGLRPRLQQLIDRWLGGRNMPPMAFLVEISPFVFAEERRYYVARRGEELAGVLVAVPVYQRDGWFFEDILRDPSAPNGTAESLVDFAMRDVAGSGSSFVTLGLAPLAGDARWQRMMRRMSAGLYNFEGLFAFKSKLRPDAWDPIYVAWPERVTPILAIYDALDAFAGGRLVRFALRTMLRAPAIVLLLLGGLAFPWAVLLLSVDTKRWFPSRLVQVGWAVFDVGMGCVLLSLARRWDRRLARVARAAAGIDAAVTVVEAAAWNVPRARRLRDVLVIGVAVAAPLLVLGILSGGLRRR
jgi:phosphatidylglycerol lysyltransferase